MKIQPIRGISFVNRAIFGTDINQIYKRQKNFINRRINLIKANDSLSEQDKTKMIDNLQNYAKKLDYKITNKPLQDFANQGKKVLNNINSNVLAPTHEKMRQTSSLIQYGLMNSNTQSKIMGNLAQDRKTAALNPDANATMIKRIDALMDDSRKSINVSSKIVQKAIGTYAEIEEAVLKNDAEKVASKVEPKEAETPKVSENNINQENTVEIEKNQEEDKSPFEKKKATDVRKEAPTTEKQKTEDINVQKEIKVQQTANFENTIKQEMPFFK